MSRSENDGRASIFARAFQAVIGGGHLPKLFGLPENVTDEQRKKVKSESILWPLAVHQDPEKPIEKDIDPSTST